MTQRIIGTFLALNGLANIWYMVQLRREMKEAAKAQGIPPRRERPGMIPPRKSMQTDTENMAENTDLTMIFFIMLSFLIEK